MKGMSMPPPPHTPTPELAVPVLSTEDAHTLLKYATIALERAEERMKKAGTEGTVGRVFGFTYAYAQLVAVAATQAVENSRTGLSDEEASHLRILAHDTYLRQANELHEQTEGSSVVGYAARTLAWHIGRIGKKDTMTDQTDPVDTTESPPRSKRPRYRYIKVNKISGGRQPYPDASEMTLRGQWLLQAGFQPGHTAVVKVTPGKIVIETEEQIGDSDE